MPAAPNLRDRVAFGSETTGSDGYGNEVTGYTDQFTVAAQIRYLRGTEPVLAERLQGVQPVVLTVRRSSQTEQITAAWRARDARDASKVFNIRSVTPSDDRAWIDLLAEVGRAV
jgi:SPP1 family predicted phage head-tail adaptor